MKKRFASRDPTQRKRKRQKVSNDEPEKTDKVKGEMLTLQTLREDMLLLGCVVKIRQDCLVMSLPGCLTGKVPVTNVSKKFLEVLKGSEEEDGETETNLTNIIKLGSTYPCKVMQVVKDSEKKPPSILLSINPRDVNSELRAASLYKKMVLHASINSVEDHGYIMDVGVKGVKGFLPFDASRKDSLHLGQVIPTLVKKLPTEKNGNVTWLSELSFDADYPEIENEDLKLSSILPGANIVSYVTEMTKSYMYLKYADFNACSSVTSLGKSNTEITIASRVGGTVLYTHPITNLIHLQLAKKPTPSNFDNFFKVRKFDPLKNVKFLNTSYNRVFFHIRGKDLGFVKKNHLEKTSVSLEALQNDPVVAKSRVSYLHYMDNLVELSFLKSFVEKKLIRLEDIKVGETYECTVKKHTPNGMIVRLSFDINGYIRYTHLSDSFLTAPEQLHPENSTVMCRVLDFEMDSFVSLTCKKSLLKLKPDGILMTYEQAKPGDSYKGVVTQKTEKHSLIMFFNGIKGLVSSDEIPSSSVFFVGQTVSCHVIRSLPEKQRMYLSLMGSEFTLKPKELGSSKTTERKVKKKNDVEKMDPKEKRTALIVNVTGHQINVQMHDGVKGRVHITELGCSKENEMPLRKYKGGSKVKVYCFDTVTLKSWNYLDWSHRKFRVSQECSFEYPPPCLPDRNNEEGTSVLGFLKKAHDDFAEVWLTPRRVGFLSYLNISVDPKKLRKLKNKLKVGLSINAKVLQVEKSDDVKIMLTQLDDNPVQAGKNVAGFVRFAKPERGLMIQLAHGYRGVVCLTDLDDHYGPPLPTLEQCLRVKFVKCHVLEVDHEKKFCLLSMRNSRLHGTAPPDMEPELTSETLTEGATVKGFVKSVLDDCLVVNIGRMLDARLPKQHACADKRTCGQCSALESYAAGDVIEGRVQAVTVANMSVPVLLSLVVKDQQNSEHKSVSTIFKTAPVHISPLEQEASQNRLDLAEDIDWGEL